MKIMNLKNNCFITNYTKIYHYVRPYLFREILATLITLPLGAMDAVIAWVLKPYMDVVMIEKSAGQPLFYICWLLYSALHKVC